MKKTKNKTKKSPDSHKAAQKRRHKSAPASVTFLWSSASLLVAGVLWAYWSTLAEIATKWANDPQYSHGYLVPAFSAYLLWFRREKLDRSKLLPSWWGLALLLAGIGIRLSGAYFYYEWLDFVSILVCAAGVAVLVGGWHSLEWSWPAIVFLFFMLPLPWRLEIALQYPLRRIGTVASVYVMQTLGMPALASGNVIHLGDVQIGVAEACSGLRMLIVFFALSVAVAIVSQRPVWERLVIVVSAAPIALICNITRITVTGSLFAAEMPDLANLVFHDLAGWLMIPLALILMWVELWLLSHLFISESTRPIRMGLDGQTSKSSSADQENPTEAAST